MAGRFFRKLCHGSLMLTRNFRSYAMLSLSVVLSFSVLLGYLAFSDASLFNRYKHVIYKPNNWAVVYDKQLSAGDVLALQALTKDTAGGSSYVMSNIGGGFVVTPDASFRYSFDIYTIPSSVFEIFDPHGPPERVAVTWLDGRESGGVSLGEGEILISKLAYEILLKDKEEPPMLPVGVSVKNPDGTEGTRWMDCTVVGTLDSPEWFAGNLSSGSADSSLVVCMFMSQATAEKIVRGMPTMLHERWVIFDAKYPSVVVKAAEQLGMSCNSIQQIKANALMEMQVAAWTKMVVVLLLFVLLGINLYGSFSNALERRRFEVGVKRALGASKWDIIGQFLWESLQLMAGNILISLVLVFDGLLIYKFVWEMEQGFSPYHKWTIYMNGTSILMFAAVTIGLTLLFSIVFAVKATQVQVVDHLKAE